MRKEADEQDEVIKQKGVQIEMLQSNLGLAAKEIKALKQARPANADIVPARSSGKDAKDRRNKLQTQLSDSSQGIPVSNSLFQDRPDFPLATYGP